MLFYKCEVIQRLAPRPLSPQSISNLLNHLANTLQKPLQQISSIHQKLFHEIVCLIQCLPRFRVFSFQLLILVYNIDKLVLLNFIVAGTMCHIINHLRNLCFPLQLRCFLLQIH